MLPSFYFIIYLVIFMKVYIDVLFFFNFIFDFIILFGIKHLLKRRVSNIRLISSALIGEVSVIFLFLPLSSISLFLLKISLSIIMIICAFKYVDFLYFRMNFLYFYVLSTLLGGVLYLFKLSLKVKSNDIISNILILLLIGPYFLYKYIKVDFRRKVDVELFHDVDIYLNDIKYSYKAYIDTGNKLTDPYKRRPIILVNDKRLVFSYEGSILVPFKTLDNEGIIKCVVPEEVVVDNNVKLHNVLIGEAKSSFNISDVDVILPNIIKEDL